MQKKNIKKNNNLIFPKRNNRQILRFYNKKKIY